MQHNVYHPQLTVVSDEEFAEYIAGLRISHDIAGTDAHVSYRDQYDIRRALNDGEICSVDKEWVREST